MIGLHAGAVANRQVWRFETRLGSKQPRNRFEMRNWQDIQNTIGDAFTDTLSRIRYCHPSPDSNRMAKMRELDAQLSGLFITRAAVSGVSVNDFNEFMEGHVEALMRMIKEHGVSVEERIAGIGRDKGREGDVCCVEYKHQHHGTNQSFSDSTFLFQNPNYRQLRWALVFQSTLLLDRF